MTGDAVGLITNVLGHHRLEESARFDHTGRAEWWTCLGCAWVSEEFDLDDSEVGREIERVKCTHIAEAVVAALGGLTPEWAVSLNGVIGIATSDRDRAEQELMTAQRNNTYWAKHHGSAPDWASDPSLSQRWVSGWAVGVPEEDEK